MSIQDPMSIKTQYPSKTQWPYKTQYLSDPMSILTNFCKTQYPSKTQCPSLRSLTYLLAIKFEIFKLKYFLGPWVKNFNSSDIMFWKVVFKESSHVCLSTLLWFSDICHIFFANNLPYFPAPVWVCYAWRVRLCCDAWRTSAPSSTQVNVLLQIFSNNVNYFSTQH